MKKKLIIGITANKKTVSVNFSAKQDVTYIADTFLDLFKSYDNIIPIIISQENVEHVEEICGILDGLIISSGEDVDPSFYKALNLIKYDDNVKDLGSHYHRSKLMAPNKKRDQFEISLYKAAKEKNIPILGICRGMQLINVAEGGTLYQELPASHISHFIEKDGWIHYHNIELDKDSKVYEIFKISTYTISSIHHQGVDKLGNNLVASARAEDGLIEIIEHMEKDFIVGFQGHIEHMFNFPLYRKVIDVFVEKAMERSNADIRENKESAFV
jgi:putative glutamine amidotransferase